MIRTGIRYSQEMEQGAALEHGFAYLELSCGDMAEQHSAEQISGIVVTAKDLTAEGLMQAIRQAENGRASYLLLDTREICPDGKELLDLIGACKEQLLSSGLELSIENGYVQDAHGQIRSGAFSETVQLKEFTDQVNELLGKPVCGICLNIGYANLLGRNIRGMIEELGRGIRMVHVHDNDGRTEQYQLPYTFTAGRGALTTDWYRIIGALVRIRFDGWMIFDVQSIFERMPKRLHGAALELLRDIREEWLEQLQLPELLKQPGKKLILVGAGNMLNDFLKAWGDQVTPEFVADNNPALWGTKRFGLEIRSVEDIRKVPPKERNVWICNQFYDQIGSQLESLGIAYHCYYDHYYLVTDPKSGRVI